MIHVVAGRPNEHVVPRVRDLGGEAELGWLPRTRIEPLLATPAVEIPVVACGIE